MHEAVHPTQFYLNEYTLKFSLFVTPLKYAVLRNGFTVSLRTPPGGSKQPIKLQSGKRFFQNKQLEQTLAFCPRCFRPV